MSMKTIKLFLGYLIAIIMLYSCIDDEGNYDYTELKTVVISNVSSNWSTPLGEEYVITPVIDYGGADSTEFVYAWVSEIQEEWSDTISREKVLRYTFKEIARYMTVFIVEHVPTGSLTSKQIDINTVSRYSTGWTILSEQNNKSILSYVRAEQAGENEITYNLFENIYTELRGDDLGTGPIRLGRHFSSASDEILVIQESGAVEISGLDFSKVITTKEEFVKKDYPSGFVPKQAEYGSRLEAILGTDGNLYTRINPNGSFQVCQYNDVPAISNAKIANMYYCAYLGYIYMYDELNHRMIGMYDSPQLYTEKIIYVSMHPDSTHLPTFTPINNMGEGTQVMYIDSYSVEGASGRDFVQIIKKGSDYYFQTYKAAFPALGDANLYVYGGNEELFVGNGYVNDNSKYCMDGSSYFYFTAGNVLYYWDRVSKVEPYYTFPGGATILDIERYAYEDREEIAVGLDNGEFYILDASFEAMTGQKEKVLFKAENLGRVVDVQYKYGNSSNFNQQSRQ